jgi:hypothetical protein
MPEYDCCLCQSPFQFGPHDYRGRPIPAWPSLMACRTCERANHDGIVPRTYPHRLPLLASLGIKVSPNEQGWIVLSS